MALSGAQHSGRTALAWCCAGALLILATALRGAEEEKRKSLSETRVELLRKIIREHIEKEGSAGSMLEIARHVLKEFAKHDSCPAVPTEALVDDKKQKKAALRTAHKLIEAKYPEPSMEELDIGAAEKYPYYEEGDIVEVSYKATPVMTRTAKGVFRGKKGDGVIVGASRILMRDITALHRNRSEILKFDKRHSLWLREEYKKKKLAKHKKDKETFSVTVKKMAWRAQRQRGFRRNEEHGYLRLNGKWYRLHDAVEVLIREAKVNAPKGKRRRRAF